MSLISYDDKDSEKVDRILDYLISLGGFDQLFGQMHDDTFWEIQKQIYWIIKTPKDPQDD